MKRQPQELKVRRRSFVLLTVIILWMIAVSGRLAYLQVVQHEALLEVARRQHQRTIRISALRGLIRDRQGRELARSLEVPSIYVVPAEVSSPEVTARELGRALKVKPQRILRQLSQAREFVWIKRKVSRRQAEAVKTLQLAGVHFVKENKRHYPNHQLAAHVLGYAGIDEAGLDGVELMYDAHLRGQEGYVSVQKDALGRSYQRSQPTLYKGQDLTLTIDAAIQMEVEKALEEGVKKSGARSGVAIVMQPKTGEILALANLPTFDPNLFSTTSEDQRRNRAIRDNYEPGSVFKIVTYAAVLEEGQVAPDDNIDCLGGRIVLAGHTIGDHKPFGILSVREALEHSSNIAAIRLALRIGPDILAEYIDKFGFGQLTRIDLPGEARGLVHPVEKWSRISIGSVAMGQEVGVTAIQMVAAMAAIANEGVWVQPHVVKALHSRAGDILLETRPQTRRVISRRTAHTLAQMLEGVILRGTGKRAQLKGYTAAGKTGTAQQYDPRTHRYSRTRYVASFSGFAPLKDPQVCILVAIDEPRNGYYGGDVAAPVFKDIGEAALQSLNVPPDSFSPAIHLATLERELTSEGTSGEAEASEIEDPAVTPLPVISHPLTAASSMMPDFKGQGIRSVAQACARLGLRLVVAGSGQAVRQHPEPGTPIRPGVTCKVEFSR